MNDSSNNKILRNTLILYLRMGISMLIGLYTSRILLEALGIEDYGINNVVGGLVSMFSIISGSLTTSISRFLTFEIGKKNNEKLRAIFSTSIIIQLLLAITIIIICEILGGWFLNTHLTIHPNRLYAANIVFHLSLIVFAINLLSIPFGSLIIAYEKMSIYAYIGLTNTLLSLITTYVVYYSPKDKLIVNAILGFIVVVLNQLFYFLYTYYKFKNCRFSWSNIDLSLVKKLSSFAGWNFIGASSSILKDQGSNILLNLFFGPSVNAARGISNAVNRYISQFINNFTVAINPQITKSYAAGDSERLKLLTYSSSKYSFYLFYLFALPIFISTEFILTMWLKHVPDYTLIFTKFILLQSLIDTLSNPLITTMLATGNIKKYQIVVGGIQMMNFPTSYLFLKLGYSPYSIYIIAITTSILCFIARIIMLSKITSFNAAEYITKVIQKVFYVFIYGIPIPYILKYILDNTSIFNNLIIIIISFFSALLSVYFIGCNLAERKFITQKIKTKILKR